MDLDSNCVYQYVSHGILDTHALAPLVEAITKIILKDDWVVVLNLVYQEANICANKIAKHGHALHLIVVYDVFPQFIPQDIIVDSMGACRPRIAHV